MLEAARILDALPKEITVGLGRTILWKNALLARDTKDAAIADSPNAPRPRSENSSQKGYGSFESLAVAGSA